MYLYYCNITYFNSNHLKICVYAFTAKKASFFIRCIMTGLFFSSYKEGLEAIQKKENFYISIELLKPFYDKLEADQEAYEAIKYYIISLETILYDNNIVLSLSYTLHNIYDIVSNCDNYKMIEKAFNLLTEMFENEITIRIHTYL